MNPPSFLTPFILANAAPAADRALVALANEFRVAADNKPLRIAYGDYPYGAHKHADGKTYFVTQRIDRAAAEAWSAALANEIARGGKGIPVYPGHPDVPDLAHKYPDKRAWGWAVKIEPGADAADLYVAWNEDTRNGFAYFSPYWLGPAVAQDGLNVTTHMTTLKSIGLVNDPNIHEFRLPNESAAAEETNTMNELHKFIAALLKIDPSSTEEQFKAALQKLADDNASLKAAADAAKAEATQAQTDKSTAETALANERNARIDVLLLQAVADGRVTPAGKPAWEKNLREDFGKFSVALANEKPQIKTASALDGARRTGRTADARGQIMALVNEAKSKGMTHDQAWAHVKSTNKELFALQA
ncbi:MAG: hypothetical protein EOM72_12165 [Opitutae bacterium]|nr:hypothetical protein [Opitutae bacterium]